jgi:hypothetical protein
MKEEGLLKKGGDLWIWFAEDARRTPVVIKSKLNFGTLTAKLESGIPAPAEKEKDEKERKPPEPAPPVRIAISTRRK